MALIPITIWQVLEGEEWRFHHIEKGHIPLTHRTITPRRFQERGAKLWRHRRAYVNDRFEIVRNRLSSDRCGASWVHARDVPLSHLCDRTLANAVNALLPSFGHQSDEKVVDIQPTAEQRSKVARIRRKKATA